MNISYFLTSPAIVNFESRLLEYNQQSMDKLFWELRQLKGRLRDDAHQLKIICNSSRMAEFLLPPLWKIVIGYWSEDERIVDLIAHQSQRDVIMDDLIWDWAQSDDYHQWTKSSAELMCSEQINGFTNERYYEFVLKFTERGNIGRNARVRWLYTVALATMLILPRIEHGNEVPIEYSDLEMRAIANLRADMYRASQ